MNPSAWDRVIDDVARDMTNGAPAPEFRERVLARVSATRQSGWLTMFAWSWHGASLAAAVVVGAIALTVVQPFRAAPVPSLARMSPAVTPAAAPGDPARTIEGPQSHIVTRRPAVPPAPVALVEWRARNIPALNSLAPIELDPIQPAGLSISQLTVRPLDDIAPIAVPSIPQIEGGR